MRSIDVKMMESEGEININIEIAQYSKLETKECQADLKLLGKVKHPMILRG